MTHTTAWSYRLGARAQWLGPSRDLLVVNQRGGPGGRCPPDYSADDFCSVVGAAARSLPQIDVKGMASGTDRLPGVRHGDKLVVCHTNGRQLPSQQQQPQQSRVASATCQTDLTPGFRLLLLHQRKRRQPGLRALSLARGPMPRTSPPVPYDYSMAQSAHTSKNIRSFWSRWLVLIDTWRLKQLCSHLSTCHDFIHMPRSSTSYFDA